MSGAMRTTRIPAPRNGGQRLTQRRRWAASLPPSNCSRNLPLMRSRLRRDRQAAPVNGFEDLIAATGEQRGTGRGTQLFRVVAVTRIAQQFRSVGIGDNRFQMQFAVLHFRKGADRNLAASAETVEQRALAGGRGAGIRVIQEC